MKRLFLVTGSIIFFLIANSVNAERFHKDDMETVRGLIEVGKNSETRTKYVKLNGELIFTTKRHDYVYIMAAYGANTKPGLLLLQFGGGNACEGFFRVLDLRGEGPVKVTEEFGNCNYLVQPEEWKAGGLQENPSYHDGAWYIALPSSDNPSKKLIWYVYRDGVVTETGKGVVEHKGEDWRYEIKLAREVPDEKERNKLIKECGSALAAYSYVIKKKAAKATGSGVEVKESDDR